MVVGFKVKFYWYKIGNGDFLYSLPMIEELEQGLSENTVN